MVVAVHCKVVGARTCLLSTDVSHLLYNQCVYTVCVYVYYILLLVVTESQSLGWIMTEYFMSDLLCLAQKSLLGLCRILDSLTGN